MPFPPAGGIQIGTLNPATPTPFDVETLRSQLENIGLNCGQLTDQNLQAYINEVNAQLPMGAVQSYAITMPSAGPPSSQQADELGNPIDVTSLAAAVPAAADAATGNWTINDKAQGYANQLEVIQVPDHFNWLYANRASNGFTGVVDSPPAYTGNYPNAAAIQQLFVNVGVTASSTLVKGLDQATMQATFSNIIQPLKDPIPANYDVPGSRAIYLVDNYNTSTGYADGIGVLTVQWTLKITDWQRKTKDGGDTHPTNLTISAWSVLYYDPGVLCADYKAVLKQFGIDPATAPPCPIS